MAYKLFTTRNGQTGQVEKDGVTGAGTLYSAKFIASPSDSFGLTLETTGTLTGTWSLWFTDEETPDLASDADWVQDTSLAIVNPAGAATKQRFPVGNGRARWGRVKYVHGGGSGDVKGYVGY
jgi:hypothetical protein